MSFVRHVPRDPITQGTNSQICTVLPYDLWPPQAGAAPTYKGRRTIPRWRAAHSLLDYISHLAHQHLACNPPLTRQTQWGHLITLLRAGQTRVKPRQSHLDPNVSGQARNGHECCFEQQSEGKNSLRRVKTYAWNAESRQLTPKNGIFGAIRV